MSDQPAVPTEFDPQFSIDEHDVIEMFVQMASIYDEPTSSMALRRFGREQAAAALKAYVEQRIAGHPAPELVRGPDGRVKGVAIPDEAPTEA